jgi:hypothetical protein
MNLDSMLDRDKPTEAIVNGVTIRLTQEQIDTINEANNKWKRNRVTGDNEVRYIFTSSVTLRFNESSSQYNDLNYTFPDRETASKEAFLHNTMILMRNWARHHNKVDGFKPDWSENNMGNWGIILKGNEYVIDQFFVYQTFIFGVSVGSKKRAEEMLKEFKGDLEKIEW